MPRCLLRSEQVIDKEDLADGRRVALNVVVARCLFVKEGRCEENGAPAVDQGGGGGVAKDGAWRVFVGFLNN